MADSPLYADTRDEVAVGSDSESPPRTPGWVKVFGITALVVIVLLVVLMLVGGGQHGPGRHALSGQQQPGGQMPLTGVDAGPGAPNGGAGGHTPPARGH